jgi:tellurite resistance protein
MERVARTLRRPPSASGGVLAPVLAQAAGAYGARPTLDEADDLAGLDPEAAALFEAVVEAAYLVANADGVFDEDERAAFPWVVAGACDHLVPMRRLDALTADFRAQLAEDGIEKRARMIARTIAERDHQIEVLRIAALMAHVSGGVSEDERAVIAQLADGFALDEGAVAEALAQAAAALDLSG